MTLMLISHYDLSLGKDKLPAGGYGASYVRLFDWPFLPTAHLITPAPIQVPDSALSEVRRVWPLYLLQIPGVSLGGVHSHVNHRAHGQGFPSLSFSQRCLLGT